jgi:hypothetical protein
MIFLRFKHVSVVKKKISQSTLGCVRYSECGGELPEEFSVGGTRSLKV